MLQERKTKLENIFKKDIEQLQEEVNAYEIMRDFLFNGGKIPNKGEKTIAKIREKTWLYIYFYDLFKTTEMKFKREESKTNDYVLITFEEDSVRKTSEEMLKEIEIWIWRNQKTIEKKRNTINNLEHIEERLGLIEEIQKGLGELAYYNDIEKIRYESGIYISDYR